MYTKHEFNIFISMVYHTDVYKSYTFTIFISIVCHKVVYTKHEPTITIVNVYLLCVAYVSW